MDIEYLDSIEGIPRHDIYLAFKDAELMQGWFTEWSFGREFLDGDIKTICKRFNLDSKVNWETIEKLLYREQSFYAGVSEKQLKRWIIVSKPFQISRSTPIGSTIQEELKIGRFKIDQIIDRLCKKFKVDSYYRLKFKLQRMKAIEIIRQGFFKTETKDIVIIEDNFYKLIYREIFKYKTDSNARNHFELNLFNGLNLHEIWNTYRYN